MARSGLSSLWMGLLGRMNDLIHVNAKWSRTEGPTNSNGKGISSSTTLDTSVEDGTLSLDDGSSWLTVNKDEGNPGITVNDRDWVNGSVASSKMNLQVRWWPERCLWNECGFVNVLSQAGHEKLNVVFMIAILSKETLREPENTPEVRLILRALSLPINYDAFQQTL